MNTCHDCGVDAGEMHGDCCDVARCGRCGGQALSCSCEEPINTVWTGLWPGVEACREFGWYSKRAEIGWVSCDKDDKDATEDLNRLYEDPNCKWCPDKHRFILV